MVSLMVIFHGIESVKESPTKPPKTYNDHNSKRFLRLLTQSAILVTDSVIPLRMHKDGIGIPRTRPQNLKKKKHPGGASILGLVGGRIQPLRFLSKMGVPPSFTTFIENETENNHLPN